MLSQSYNITTEAGEQLTVIESGDVLDILKRLASDGDLADVSARLSSSLGECVEGNDYEIVADKDGRFWINHKVVGSGEPLNQWIDSVLNVC